MVAYDSGFTKEDTENLRRVKEAMAKKAVTGDMAAATAFAGILTAEINRYFSEKDDKALIAEARKYDDASCRDRANLEQVKSAIFDKAVGGDIAAAGALETLVNVETRLQELNRKGLDAFDKSEWSERVR